VFFAAQLVVDTRNAKPTASAHPTPYLTADELTTVTNWVDGLQ
jgi:hypothetical protein